MRKILCALLVFVFLASIAFPGRAGAIDLVRLYQDPSDPNKYYFVGLVYFDVWKYAAGDPGDPSSWTNGKMPGMRTDVDGFVYRFTFAKNRKVKSVNVSIFDYDMPLGTEIFMKSRSGELQAHPISYYQDATSYSYSFIQQPVTGIGTNEVTVPVYVSNGLLDARIPVDRRREEEEKGQKFADGVMGYRYFFPTLFTIELEPEQGKAIIKHFTTTGQSLAAVFPDRTEDLIKGEHYAYTHPTHPDYEYVGYKKSTVSAPSGGSILPGDPPAFTYDGSFPTYYAYFYYQASGSGGSPGEVPETREESVMDPEATGVIRADPRGSEMFDVEDGIPSSESLYGNVIANSYLYSYRFNKVVGKKTYTVTVRKTYNLTWQEQTGEDEDGNPIWEDRSDTETKEYTYDIERPYSYWEIAELQVYRIQKAVLNNYALPGESITITPTGYVPPSVSATQYGDVSAHIQEPTELTFEAPPGTINGGRGGRPQIPDEDFRSLAESQLEKIKVRNDKLIWNGGTIMDDSWSEERTSEPGEVPYPPPIGPDVLYKPGNIIEPTKTNRQLAPSSGTITYQLITSIGGGDATLEFPIEGINPVTVHTPVVMVPTITDDRAHNQRVTPDLSRAALILERPFTVTMPTAGQHQYYKGYGFRDYAKYTARKQVLFPFDVYNESRTRFYPANTWIDVPVNQTSATFWLPVWVDEGNYTVHFRAIAINAPSDFTWQTAANLNVQHHVAVNSINVQVIGRLYDFRITDISDFDWELVFRKAKGSKEHTDRVFWVGDRDIDGNFVGNRGLDGRPVNNSVPLYLPVMQGKHPVYRNVAVKTGYKFSFDFKTKGNMFGPNDMVRITPTFYFVKKDGTGRIPVDLYYHDYTNKKYFVKVGSQDDVANQYVILDERLRNVPQQEIIDTANYIYDHYGSSGMTRSQFVAEYLRLAKKKVYVGRYSGLMIPYQLRTFIGPKTGLPAGVDPQRANAAIQKWYGEYYLPPAVYIVPAGTNLAEYARKNGGLTDDSPIFLKNGYLIVNFNIETIRNGKTNEPYLRYYRLPGDQYPFANQWQMEGFRYNQTDKYGVTFQLIDGDVIFYHGNLSSYDDVRVTVPH